MRKKIIAFALFFLCWSLIPENQNLFPEQLLTQEEWACQYLEKGEIDKAIEILEKELKISPQNLNTRLYMGIAFYLKKNLEIAFKEFEKIEKEIDKMLGASDTFGDQAMFIQLGMERKASVLFSEEKKGLFYFFRGLTLKEKNDLKNAQKKFKEARKFHYDNTNLFLELIDLCMKKKDLNSARAELAEYRKSSGETPIFFFLDGWIKYENDEIEASLAALEKIAGSVPEAGENRGRILYNSGDYKKAIEIWEEILLQNPENKEVQTNLGYAYFLLGDQVKAQEYLGKAGVKISPEKYTPKKIPLNSNFPFKERKFDLQCKK